MILLIFLAGSSCFIDNGVYENALIYTPIFIDILLQLNQALQWKNVKCLNSSGKLQTRICLPKESERDEFELELHDNHLEFKRKLLH